MNVIRIKLITLFFCSLFFYSAGCSDSNSNDDKEDTDKPTDNPTEKDCEEGETYDKDGEVWKCVDGKWEGGDGEVKEEDLECKGNSSADGYQTLKVGDSSREYLLFVPDSYDENTSYPLVLSFHGFGGCAYNFVEEVGGKEGLNSVANAENFIVAYPQAIVSTKVAPSWDPANIGGADDIIESDMFFVEQLIVGIKEGYNIDLTKVYATGYSNGGMMSYGLACHLGNKIAAIGIMSGIMLPDNECNADETTSIVAFHSLTDGVLPFEGNEDFQSVSKTIDFWLKHNAIPDSTKVTTDLDEGAVTRDVFSNESTGINVTLYKFKVV